MAQLFWLSGQTLVDGNGAPYAGAKATFLETGTTTPKNTYSNAGLTSANANPVVADADGRFGDIYLIAGRYKVTLTTSADVAIDTLDPVDGTSQLITASSAPGTTYPFLRYYNTTDGRVYRRNAANSAWIDEGLVDELINAATVSEVLTGTSTSKAVTPDALAGLWQRGADIASSSTISLPAGGGYDFNVTGTTTITGISSAQGGRKVRFKFASSLGITHNATSMVLPGGVSIVTRAGDIAEFTNEAAQDASGSNWRLTDYLRNLQPIETPSSAKTAGYTVATTDRGGFIRFSGLSADVTLTLPAVSGLAGFTVTFANTDGTYAVTVDANGSETIDGFTTRKHSGPGPITLFCDGTAWYTMAGRWRSVSAEYTLSASTTTTYAHGLGVTPASISFICECLSTDAGYAVGELLILGYNLQSVGSGSAIYGWVTQADATNVYLRCSASQFGTVLNKSSLLQSNLTYGNWSVRIVAEA